jgi:hypothetical protein
LLGRCFITWDTRPSPFCFSYFWDRVLLYPWQAWAIYTSHLAEMTGVYPAFIGWDGILLTFCPGQPGTTILLILASST